MIKRGIKIILKSDAINILKEIEEDLKNDNREKAIKDIDYYIKNIEITTNKKINELIYKYLEMKKNYGLYDKRTISISKKIDKEMLTIFLKDE